MKKSLPLKWFVLIITLSLTIILIIGFSMLSGRYFLLGMDNMIASNMEQTIHKYHDSIRSEQQLATKFDSYQITQSWEQQPENIRRAFELAPKEAAALYKIHNRQNNKKDKGVFFAMRWQIEDESYFISHHITRKTISKMVHENIQRSRMGLKVIGLICIITFGLIFLLIMRRVSAPVASLNKWTKDLTPETLNEPIPDFSYSELNEQAELTRNSLSSVQVSFEREQRFLRQTSHELRTPISVIRSNVDLMHKLHESETTIDVKKQKEIFDRIDRASLTMKDLTETLLWLSRDEDEKLPHKNIRLDELIEHIIDETRYLLKNKQIDLKVEIDPILINISEASARIVLGNLIRNAFQHTTTGCIKIVQHGHLVRITNDNDRNLEDIHNDNDLGFGLGLQLTAQLTKKLHWDYKNEQKFGHNQVEITVKEA